MSYTRKFQRSHEQSDGHKAAGRTLQQRTLAAAAAAGLLLNPAAAFAANIITKADGTQLNAVNNVTQIYADKIVGNAAVNTFKDFRVEANNIVNMYFKTSADAAVESNNLVNFVNSRVIIEGTVNSVYNSKIGGNLYFLSTDGFAVGRSGVINAGSLYAATPSSDFMDTYKKYAVNNDAANFNTLLTGWSAMPLNNSGTISVLGRVNTVNGINMRAAQIKIGEGAQGVKDSNASLRSDVTDFADLVNISSANINAGLGTNLVASASADASGDIVLTAWADTVNDYDADWANNSAQNLVQAKVESHGAIISRGNVDISATATNGVAYSAAFGDEEIGSGGAALDFWGQMVKTKADVQIDGDVTAAADVNIKAHTGNYYVSDISEEAIADNTKIEGATNPFSYTQYLNSILGLVSVNMDAAYAVLGGEATVTVGKSAVITARDLDIMADSVVRTGVGASTAAFKLTNLKKSNKLPGMAITVANIQNEANVTIDGQLHASGDTSIEAKADTTLEAVASGALSWQFSGAPTLVDLAILEADGNTSSKVTVNNAVDGAGDVTIKAATLNSVDTEAAASSLEQSIASTAVNVTIYDSSADVIVNDAVKGKNVTITAGNSTLKNTVTADNAVGSAFFLNELIELGQGSVAVQSGVDFFGGLSRKVFGESSPGSTKLDDLGRLISVGASVAVADESSGANVALGKNALVQANDGGVKITASNIIQDTWMHAAGATSNYHKDDGTNEVLVNASVLYAKMDNQAGVVLEGGDSHNADGAQYTQLRGNSVSVAANSEFQYNRINMMIGELLTLCEQLKLAYTSSPQEYKDKVDALASQAEAYRKAVAENPEYANSVEGNEAAVALAVAAGALSTDGSLPDRVGDMIFGPFNVPGMLLEFADPLNYANFQAGSSTGGKDISKDGAQLAVAGTANVNDLTNTAQVIVGKNSVIDGGTGAVKLDAKVVQQDVALSGKLGYSSGGNVGVGGLVGLQWSDTNSLVAVAEGAQITAGDAALNAANDVMHTNVTFGAGMYDGVGLAGMAGYLEGSSNSLVSVDDEAVLKASGSIDMAAANDTIVSNFAGGGVLASTVSMGAGIAINDYDINSMTVIGDNDFAGNAEDASDISTAENNAAASGDLTAESIFGSGDSDAAAKMRELLTENVLADAAAVFGSKENENVGKLTAQNLDVSSHNGSIVNSAAVAGSIMTGSDGNAGVIDKTINWGTNKIHALFNQVRVLDEKLNSKLTGSSNLAYHAPTNTPATNRTKDMPLPKLTLSAAGSVAANVIEGSTAAVLDGVTVELIPAASERGAVSVKAEDAAFTGAWSGAGAISYKTLSTSQNENNVNMGIAGSVAVNAADTEALALIKGSEITDAGSIINEAQKRGALVAAGLGLVGEITSGGGGVNIAANADSSVNAADNKVQALMLNNKVGSSGLPTNITNIAYDDDTQLTGGVNLELAFGGKGGAAIGGTLGYSDIDNTVEARISGGNYSNAGVVDVQAVTDITQIGVGVGANIIHASSGSVSAEGVAVYNSLDNNVQAVIENAAITAQQVGVQAYDSDGAALGTQSADGDGTAANAKNYDKYISDRGLDPTGASYLYEFANTAEVPNASSGQNAYALDNPDANGNLIITGALSVGINASKGAGVGAAVAVNDINNDFNAAITGSVITASGAAAQDVLVNAKSETLMLGAAAGSAIGATTSTDLSVAGSVTWQNLDNDVTASINSSKITAGSTAVQAASEALAVNVTGQVSLGSVAAGLALAQTSVENTTGAYVEDSTITANTYKADGTVSSAAPGALAVTAQNSGQQYTVAAGVGVSTGYAAVNGTVTVNLGHNDVEAVIDKSALENMQSVGVRTLDESILASTAGGVGAGKYAAMGGSVAYNEVGSLSGSEEEKKQLNRAQINDTEITTANAGKIEVAAQDETLLVTGAIGVGITGSSSAALAAEGAAATALLNKATEASMNAADITTYENTNTKADVAVTAASSSSSITTADVASVTGSGTASISMGAGVAVSRSEADTLALVSGGRQAVQNLNVLAQSAMLIDTVGVGGSVGIAGEGAGVAVQGNVAVNLINNDTMAKISGGADITADNNVGVVALSDEIINNYAGTAAVGGSAAAGVGVGVSVSVNEINGSTTASIGDEGDDSQTSVTALGLGDGLTTKTAIAEGEINDTLIDSETVAINAKIDRSAETRQGIVVDASSTHDIKSFLVNAAVGAGVGVAGVTGTVNVNSIGGATSASVSNAVLNGGASGTIDAGDVSVKAGDYTNSAGFVGSVGVGAGIGAGAGLGSDTNLIERSVWGQAVDSDIAADAFALDAVSRQGVSSFTLGLGIGGVGLGAAGVVSVVQLENTTRALADGVTIDAASTAISADHKAMTNAGTVSAGEGVAGVGAGFSVGVLQDNSATEALVGGSDSQSNDKATIIETDGDISVQAHNYTSVRPVISANAIGAGGLTGAVSVNNINSTVRTAVEKASLSALNGSIKADANNIIDVNAYIGADTGSIVGVGSNVTVNTIDSTVQTNINDSDLAAGRNIDVTAGEDRRIEQLATNAALQGVGATANIAVTNVGKEISIDEGETDVNKKNNLQAVMDAINQANAAYEVKETDADGNVTGVYTFNPFGSSNTAASEKWYDYDYTLGALELAGSSVTKPAVDAGFGEDGASQITVNIAASEITAGDTFTAKAAETDAVKMTLGSGSAGLAAVNAGVGLLNVHRNVGVKLDAADITAGNTAYIGSVVQDSSTNGGVQLEVYQGTGGLIGVNAAYGGVTTEGFSRIDVADSAISGKQVNILASDNGTASVDSLGITAGAIVLGAIISEADNSSDTSVAISGTQITGTAQTADGDAAVTVGASKANSVTAHAKGGAGGAASGTAVAATAEDKGSAVVTVQNGSKLTAEELNLQAVNKPAVKAVADSVAAALIDAVGTAVALADVSGGAGVTVGNSSGITGVNELLAGKVNINALTGAQDGQRTVEAQAEGNNGAGVTNISANAATASAKMSANVTVSDTVYKTQEEVISDGIIFDNDGKITENKKTVTVGATQLNISGVNAASAAADARGVNVGGIFASGENIAEAVNTSTVNISLGGGSTAAPVLLDSLNVSASGTADNLVTADGSGGALVNGDLAAWVSSTINSNFSTTLSGSFEVAGDVLLNSQQNDKAELNADAVKAAVLGGSATKADNAITGSNTITFNGAAVSSGGTITADAVNQLVMGEQYKYAVEGSGYGGANVQGAQYDNNIDKAAAVNLIGASLVSSKEQALAAQTEGSIATGGYIKAAGGGEFTWVDVDNSVAVNNAVNVDNGSSMKTLQAEQDITLAAADTLAMTVTGIADTQGAAVGGASSNVNNVLSRTNSVHAAGNLYSMHDVNLYAGRDKNGKDSRLDLALESEAYNKTAIGVAVPELSNSMTQNNSVTIGAGADVSSVRNINLYADAGVENVRETDIMYNWYYSEGNDSFTSSTMGQVAPHKTADNFVQVDGSLTAGVQNKQYITIGTAAGQLVFADADVLAAVKQYGIDHNNGQENAISVSELLNSQLNVSDNVAKDGITVGTMDYGVELFRRYYELGQLMSDYSEKYTDGNNNEQATAAYWGYKAERERVLAEMESLGLVQEATTEKGATVKIPVTGMTIDYISLPDIVASGGNITIQTDTLSGSGSLKAQGSPEVTITNNTNLYLKVNDVLVGDEGGAITYNTVHVTKDNYASEITRLNSDSSKEVSFNSLSEDASASGGKITISGNYSGAPVYAEVSGEMTDKTTGVTVSGSGTVSLIPKADIEINGNVVSENGIVTVTSAANDIIIQGADAGSSASVQGKEVYLTAAKGSINQSYQDGIYSVVDVQPQYQQQYDNIKAGLDTEYMDKEAHTYKTGTAATTKGNLIAGENIYINALDINVNGYIQSGYSSYELVIPQDAENKIKELTTAWQQSGSPVLSDAVVTSSEAYRIVDGGVNSATPTTYNIAAYYNPSTGKIVVPDVDAKGGRVYLTGRISSTGNGSINVLDGAYDITIDNSTASDIQLGNLVSNNVQGLISITDTASPYPIVTEYYRDKIVYTYLNLEKDNVVIDDYEYPEGRFYEPQKGLRYNWTTGKETVTTKTYEHVHKAGLWGLVETMDETQLKEYETEENLVGNADTAASDKKNGEYIGVVDSIKNDDALKDQDFVVLFDNIIVKEETTTPTTETWSSGFLNWFKWEKVTWQEKTGTTQQYFGSVKADNPIAINFFDNGKEGASSISITSRKFGNVDLTGNIKTTDNSKSDINIEVAEYLSGGTSDGMINGLGGTLTSDNIKLQAKRGMNDIAINSWGDTVNLWAYASEYGNIDISVNGAYGKKGDVSLDRLSVALGGKINLTAQGSITQDESSLVIANSINLVSLNGGIGTSDKALTVSFNDYNDNASINASAYDSIYISDYAGSTEPADMRIGRIYSEVGDVTLTVNNGSLVDALPAGEPVDRGDTDALLQKWRDLGLIDGEGVYTAKQAQAVQDYQAGVAEEFALYEQQKAYYADAKNIPSIPADGEDSASYNIYQGYLQMEQRYGAYESADAYLASAAAQAHIAELQQPGAGWNEKQLLYALQDSIINPDSTATDNIVKDPNIKGRNITLNAANGSVGLNSDTDTIIALEGLYSDDRRLDDLQALAGADAASITWDAAKRQFIISEKYPIGVQMTSGGKLNVIAQDNIYLAGRTVDNVNESNALNIERLESTHNGNIRLQGHNGIYNVRADENAAIIGKDLLIQAGGGDIGGTSEQNGYMMNVLLGKRQDGTVQGGVVQAQAAQNLALRQLSADTLQISSMSAGGNIDLRAAGDIVNSDLAWSEEENAATNYIKSDSGTITIVSDSGSVGTIGTEGTQGKALRIFNTDDSTQLVNITAQNINIEGISNSITADAPASGSLFFGEVQAAGQANIYVNGDVGVSGTFTAKDAVIQAAKDVLVTESGVLAAENADVKADNDIWVYGQIMSADGGSMLALEDTQPVVSGGTVGLDAGRHVYIMNGGSITAQGAVDVDAGGTADVSGVISSFDAVTVDAGADISVSGTIEAEGEINTTASTSVDISGALSANGNEGIINVNAGTNANISGALTADDAVSIDVVAGNITVSGAVDAGDAVSIDASGSIDVENTVIAGSTLDVNAGTNAIISGAADAIGAVNITAQQGNAVISGAINAGDAVSIDASGSIDVENTVIAGSTLDVNAGTNATVSGAVDAIGAVNITAQQGNAEISNAVKSGSTVDVLAGNNVTIHGIADEAGVKAGGINAGGAVNITAQKGNASIDNTVDSVGAITINALKEVTITDALTAENAEGEDGALGVINVNAGTDASISGTLTADDAVSIDTVAGNITVSGAIDAGDAVSVDAAGSIAVENTVIAGSTVDVSAGTNATVSGAVDAIGAVNITAQQGNAEISNAVKSGSTVDVTAGMNATVNGTVDAIGAVDITAQQGNAEISNTVKSGSTVDVSAEMNATVSGAIDAIGAVNITAQQGNAEISNAVKSGSTVDIVASADITVSGELIVDEAVSARAGNDALISGTIDTDNIVSIDAVNNVIINGIADEAGEKAGGINAGGTVNITAQNGNATIDNTVDSVGAITVNALGEVTITDALTAENAESEDGALGVINVNAGTDAFISGALTADDAVSIDTVAGNITVNGAVDAGGTVSISAGTAEKVAEGLLGNAVISGAINAGDAVSIDATGSAAINNRISANGAIDIDAGDTITIGSEDTVGSLIGTGSGAISLNAGGNIIVSGDITQSKGSVIVESGKDVQLKQGTLTAADLYLSESKDAIIGDNILQQDTHRIITDNLYGAANNGIALLSANNELQHVNLWNAGTGEIHLVNNGANDLDIIIEGVNSSGITILNNKQNGVVSTVNILSPLEAVGTITLTNNAGDIAMAQTAEVDTYYGGTKTVDKAVSAGGDIVITGSGSITSGSSLSAGQNIALTADADITNVGAIKAQAGDVTAVTDKGSIVFKSQIDAGQNVSASTNTGSISYKGTVNALAGKVENTVTQGDINFADAVQAGTNIIASVGAGNINYDGIVSAGSGVTAKVTDGVGNISYGDKVTAATGSVTANTYDGNIIYAENVLAAQNVTASAAATGSVSYSGTVTATAGSVETTTEAGAIGFSKDVNAGQNIGASTVMGSVSYGGVVNAGNDISVSISDGTGGISYTGDVIAADGSIIANTAEGDISYVGNVKAIAGDIVATTAEGDISYSGVVNAGNSVSATTNAGDISYVGEITAVNDIVAEVVKSGDISYTGEVTAQNGSITTTAGEGDISFAGSVEAGTDVSASTSVGAISYSGVVNAGDSVSASTITGDVSYSGIVNAGDSVSAETESGSISYIGEARAQDGSITTTAGEGNISFDGSVETGTDVNASTMTGDINYSGVINAGDSVNANTITGNVSYSGVVNAGDSVSASTMTGDVSYSGVVNASDSISAETESGNISYTGEVTAVNDIAAKIKESGSISYAGEVTAQDGSVTTTAGEGDISFEGSVDAGTDVSASTTTGEISYSGVVNAGDSVSATTNAGDISYTGEVTAQNGSVTTTAGEGIISFEGSVEAGTDVSASTTTGGVNYNGTVNAGDSVSASTTVGEISYSGVVNAGDSVSAETESGSISYTGEVSAQDGSVTTTAGEGNISFEGSVEAGTDVSASTTTGEIHYSGTVNAGDSVSAETESGSISYAGEVTADNGSVTTTVGEGDISFEGSVEAGTNVNASTITGGVSYSGVVNAGDSISAETESGSISYAGEVNAQGGSVTTVAGKGDISFEGRVDAGTDVSASTITGDVSYSGVVNAGDSVNASTTTGEISYSGVINAGDSISAETESGNISYAGEVTAQDGSVTTTTGEGNISFEGSMEAGADVSAATESGSISYAGEVTAQDGSVTTTAGEGDISFEGSVDAGTDVSASTTTGEISYSGVVNAGDSVSAETESGSISYAGEVTADNGSVTTTVGEGNIIFDGSVDAGTDVSARTTTGDVSYSGVINAGDSVSAETESGSISYTGEVTAQNGSVATTAGEGDISFEGSVEAGTDVSASTTTGEISYSGVINAGDSISAETESGDISYTGEVNAQDGSITTTAGEGNISFAGSVDAGTDVSASTTTGEISYNGEVSAGDSISAATENGSINYTDNVIAEQGDIAASTSVGDISYNGYTAAGQSILAEIKERGSISFAGDVTADAGDITASTVSGDVTLDGAVQAGQNITLRADTNGDITLNDSVTAGNNFTVVTDNTAAGKGNIVINSEVNAGKNIGLKTQVGDMQINDTVTSSDGTIGLVITGSGDIFQADNRQGSLQAINGSVNVVNTGTGDVDLTEIYALDNARVGLVNGDLHLYEINGNLVAIVLRTEGKEMDVEHIVAAAQVIVRGSDMDLDDIEQRIDGEGMLVITPGGTAFDKPIDNFDIGDIETNGTSGIRIERLWVNNANVSTDEGKLFIDKLFVEDKALFTNKGMVTSVYGTAPVWDGSNSVYWQNTAERRPEQNLNSWLLGPNGKGSGWMYLNFAENKGVQYSNGVLLHLQDHYYVYDQRFSGVGHLRYLNSDGLSRGYELEHIPSISYYNRYDNYELPEIVLSAAEDELIIE